MWKPCFCLLERSDYHSLGFVNYKSRVGSGLYFKMIFKETLCPSAERELVTPPLDGIILPGVTRQSLLDLARQWVSVWRVGQYIVYIIQRNGNSTQPYRGFKIVCSFSCLRSCALNIYFIYCL